ncbi:MAG: hypothetical protein ACXADF_17565, partial [Candidatus Thorarchaeota archaeon]
MDLDKSKIPKTKNPIVSKVLAKAIEDAEQSLIKKKVALDLGFFGETGELAAYAFIRSTGGDPDSLVQAKAVDDLLQLVYRDEVLDISEDKLLSCLTLGFYGFLFTKYNDEDFRYLYRYSMRAIRKHDVVENWLKKALVFEALLHHNNPEDILDRVLFWLRYLGAPIFNPKGLLETCREFDVNIERVLEQSDFRLVDTLRRHSDYLEEALGERSYFETREATRDWLPDALSSKLLTIYRSKANEEAQA